MSNNRPTRRKAQAPATTALAPIPSPPPKFRCAEIEKKFKLGDYYCQLLLPTGPNDRTIDTVTLIARGRYANADMNDEAANLFNTYRHDVPSELKVKRIIFPESHDDEGRIRCLELPAGGDWCCMLLLPIEMTWDNNVALVQLTADVSTLL